jgi:hypothetical protein
MADEVLQHLVKINEYRDLEAADAEMKEQVQVGWAASDEATVLEQRLNLFREDAGATTIIETPDGRELQYSTRGQRVVDPGISVADLEKSRPYRSTIAEAIAQNIITAPLDAKTEVALDRFRVLGHSINNAALPASRRLSLSDWLDRFDDGDSTHRCALNTPPFLDLAACLKSLPQPTDPQKSFDALTEVTGKIAFAHTILNQMLKDAAQQALDQAREDSSGEGYPA